MNDQTIGVDGRPVDEPAAPEHNSAERKRIIKECADGMRRIKADRKELNEQAKDIRERLKNNSIETKSFEAALRIADMDDDNARDTYVDGLSEAFNALSIGGQLDFVSVLEDDHKEAEAAD